MMKNLFFLIVLFLCCTSNMLADREPLSRCYYENGIKYEYYGIADFSAGEFVVSLLWATVVYNQQNPYSGNVIIPNSVTIKDIKYYDGTKWIDEVSMPVCAIDDDAFVDCKELVSITIPASMRFQGGTEYYYYTIRGYNLNNPFRGCSNLEKIVFEEGHPFYNECNAIIVNNKLISACKNTIVPEEVKTIGPYAFSGLEPLTSIDVNKATTINEGAFKGCTNINSLVCRSSYPPRIAYSNEICIDEIYWNDVFDESMKNTTLYVNDCCIEKYKEDEVWSQFKEILPIEKVTDFNLIYYVDDEVYKTVQYKYDDEITPLENPIKEGHTFSGWSEIPERMPGKDVNVYGSFKVNSYKITYLVDGEEYKSYDMKYGAIITPETEPQKEGYTFSGWSTIPETMPAHDITITGFFSLNSYKLTYKVDGEDYKVFEVDYNEIITPEIEPTRKGMTFSGWDGLPEKMPAKDVEVTGFFSWSTTSIDDVIYQVLDTMSNCASVIGGGNEGREIKIVPTIEFDDIYTVTTIIDKAFYGKRNLERIEICENVTSIGERAFANIDKLTDVTIYSEIIPETDRTAFENSYIDYVTLHVPAGSVEKYKTTGPWKNFKEIVPIEGGDLTIVAPIRSVDRQKDSYNLNGIKISKANKTIKSIIIRDGKKYYLR